MRGGSIGLYGTAPIVYAAASLINSGEDGGVNPEVVLERRLGTSVVNIIPTIHGRAKRFINSYVSCPGTCVRPGENVIVM